MHLNGRTWETVYEGDEEFVVKSFFEDSRHNCWFGTSPKGKFILSTPE
jgi:hypothetical protein